MYISVSYYIKDFHRVQTALPKDTLRLTFLLCILYMTIIVFEDSH